MSMLKAASHSFFVSLRQSEKTLLLISKFLIYLTFLTCLYETLIVLIFKCLFNGVLGISSIIRRSLYFNYGCATTTSAFLPETVGFFSSS